MNRIGELIQTELLDTLDNGKLLVSKQKLRQIEGITLVRTKRESVNQTIGFNSRPFVICGLPIRRPKAGQLTFSRRNGDMVLEIEGSPRFGLPFGQDRLIPIMLATLAVQQQNKVVRFKSAAKMLEMFGKRTDGAQYKRLVQGFQRIFGATVFFGNDETRKAPIWFGSRFNFLDSAKLWFAPDSNQETLFPDDEGNVVVLSDHFFNEIMQHPIPCDLGAVRVLAANASCLDMYIWICYRCYTARQEQSIPLFGRIGLINQVGNGEYTRPRKFRENVKSWLQQIRTLWPECPAQIASDGQYLIVRPGKAIHSQRELA